MPDTTPDIRPLDPGVYSWCTCGFTREEPFCDGAHIGKGMCPMTFTLEESRTVALCRCKKTRTPPYCDGSHQGR